MIILVKLTNYISYYLLNPNSIKTKHFKLCMDNFIIVIDIKTLNPLKANRTCYKTFISKFGCHKVSSVDRTKSQICIHNVLSTFKKLEMLNHQDYQISFAVLA
jgi:hypothetical protein